MHHNRTLMNPKPKGSSAVGIHNNAMGDHGEMVDVGGPEVVVPKYGVITEDWDGRAYLPYDFFASVGR